MKKLLKSCTTLFLLIALQPLNYSQTDTVKLFTPHSSTNNYDTNTFWTIKVDSKDVVWAGSKFDGLFKYENNTWTQYPPSETTTGDIIGLTLDSNENLWLGSNGLKSGVEFNGTNFNYYPAPDSLGAALFSVVTNNNKVWYGGENDYLYMFDGQKWAMYDKIDINTPIKRVRSITKDSQGNIWFADMAEPQSNVVNFTKYLLVKYDGQSFAAISTEQSQIPGSGLYCIAVDKNDHVWYANIDSNLVEYNGQDFTIYSPPAGKEMGFIYSVAVDNNSNIWLSAEHGIFNFEVNTKKWTQYKYSDLGLMNGEPGSEVRQIAFDSKNNLWMSSNWGIVEFKPDGIVTGIRENKNQTPDSYLLSQNYPNPFNPSTIIKYQVPKESFVNIKVYNVIGKEIGTLVNENKQAGVYEVNFNASSLPSGVYFYRIISGNYTTIKKMMLLK